MPFVISFTWIATEAAYNGINQSIVRVYYAGKGPDNVRKHTTEPNRKALCRHQLDINLNQTLVINQNWF